MDQIWRNILSIDSLSCNVALVLLSKQNIISYFHFSYFHILTFSWNKMSGNFVTEADLEEARKNRQAEWERVRKPDDPEEAPEETYDHRSLFERLEEHKRVKVNI